MYKNQGRFSKLSPAGVKHPLACDIYLRRSPSYHLICGVYINYLSLEISTLCKELYYDDYSILDLCTLYLYFPWLKETPISIREAAKKVFLLMAWPLRPHHLPPPSSLMARSLRVEFFFAAPLTCPQSLVTPGF